MANENETAIVRVEPRHLERGPIRPVVRPAELIEAHKEAALVIREALEDGRDYGVIPGAGARKVLLKAGAERLTVAFGLRPRFTVTSSDCDHDRVVSFTERSGRMRQSLGVYRYTLRCELLRDDVVVGEGVGSCSTMESKYISRPRDCENTVLKMAKKRALVDAVLGTLSLSDRFTQDVGDDDEEDAAVAGEAEYQPREPTTRPMSAPSSRGLDMGAILDLAEAVTTSEADGLPGLLVAINTVTDDSERGRKVAFALERLIEQRAAQFNDDKWVGDDKAAAAVLWIRGQLELRAARKAGGNG